MMIRVQEQDNNANGYLDSNISSIDIQQVVLMMMIANVQDSKQVVPHQKTLIGRRIPYGIEQDISSDITFIHMVSIIQEGGSTSDPQL